MFKIRYKAFAIALLACASLAGHSNVSGLSGKAWANSVDSIQHQSIIKIRHGDKKSRNIKIGLNKSTVVELPAAVSDVLVSNPKMLDAVVHTSKRVYLIGMKVGQVNVFFFDKSGAQISTLEVKIERDVAQLRNTLNRLISGSNISVETIGDNIILTGSVRNPADATRAKDIAQRMFIGVSEQNKQTDGGSEGGRVMNMIVVQAKEQVMLKVIVAEMSRKVAKELKIQMSSAVFSGNIATGLINTPSLLPGTSALANDNTPAVLTGINTLWNSGRNQITQNIKMLEENGLVKTLAEPTLTALSGETAKFHAGGEFGYPISSGVGSDRTYSIEYKKFGVQLNFTPVVMSENRISLKIKSNVSELNDTITVGDYTVPTLSQRETETTIELPSGGSMVIGGLIQERIRQNIDGLPGLKDLPVLGALFRSSSFLKEETELVVIVTPYMVNPVATSKLEFPGRGFAPASDAKRNFLGRMNRVYGHRKEPVRRGRDDLGRSARRINPLTATGFIVE